MLLFMLITTTTPWAPWLSAAPTRRGRRPGWRKGPGPPFMDEHWGISISYIHELRPVLLEGLAQTSVLSGKTPQAYCGRTAQTANQQERNKLKTWLAEVGHEFRPTRMSMAGPELKWLRAWCVCSATACLYWSVVSFIVLYYIILYHIRSYYIILLERKWWPELGPRV